MYFEILRTFNQTFRVILIKRNQENKVDTPKIHNKKTRKKMPVFNCECGIKILIVPDLPAMSKAIENHLIEHKKITGQCLTEEILIQEILSVITET